MLTESRGSWAYEQGMEGTTRKVRQNKNVNTHKSSLQVPMATKNSGNLVLATIPLQTTTDDDEWCLKESVVVAKIPKIPDIASLSVHLPKICKSIFAKIGCQQTESVYQNCLKLDLEEAGLGVIMEPEIELTYKGQVVGTRRPDLVVQDRSGNKAILELKAVDEMNPAHMKQLEFYLHHLDIDVGYLINFPHDYGFPSVDTQSSFQVRFLSGLRQKIATLLPGAGPTLRLRNSPENRPDVDVLQVNRRYMDVQERQQQVAAKTKAMKQENLTNQQKNGFFGRTRTGTWCRVCIKENGFCRQHKDQAPQIVSQVASSTVDAIIYSQDIFRKALAKERSKNPTHS